MTNPIARAAWRATAAATPQRLPGRVAAATLSEHDLQRQVTKFLDAALPSDAWWTSIDSAGRGAVAGARMKARGVRKGIPDLLVYWRACCIWIELKSAKGRMTGEQMAFWAACSHAGQQLFVCRSVADVGQRLTEQGIPLRARLS